MKGREGIDLILNVRITMMFTWKLEIGMKASKAKSQKVCDCVTVD